MNFVSLFAALLVSNIILAVQSGEIKIDDREPTFLKFENGRLVKFPYEKNESIDLKDFIESHNEKIQKLKESHSTLISSPLKTRNLDENVPKRSGISQNISELDQEILDNNPFIRNYNIFGANPRKNKDGEFIVDGDIALAKDDEESSTGDLQPRKATDNPTVLWPGHLVVYEFHNSVPPQLRALIEEAIDHWRDNTCLKFEKRNTKHWPFWYLKFRHDQEGCWSMVGNVIFTLRGQDVSIGRGCEYKDTIIHEIGHAIGFFHEQSRSDRDNYNVLLEDNIEDGMQPQFFKSRDKSFNVPYDIQSEMQYDMMAFSNRPFEKNTLVTKNVHDQRLMGKYHGLSFRDRKIANMLYSCGDKCSNKDTVQCQNTGYLRPYRDQMENCTCDCPTGTSGETCQVVDGDYYGAPVCGQNVTEPQMIQTPNYPVRTEPYQDCSWWIQAPAGQKVRVEFLDFNFDRRLNRTGHPLDGLCVFERVEIRTEDRYRGDMYCAEDIAKGTIMTSKSEEFIILIFANKYKVGRGLQANVTFV